MSIQVWDQCKKGTPLLANYTFDTITEQALTLSVEVPTYPIENGVQIADHRVIQPMEYMLHGIVSNSGTLEASVTDFAGGVVSNLTNNPVVAAVAGMSAGYLAGSDSTRATAAMEELIKIMESHTPFDVDTGDMILRNLCIVEIRREITLENENAAEVELRLREMITLDRITTDGMPSHSIVRDDTDTEKSGSGIVSKMQGGLKSLKDAGSSAVSTVKGWFS